MNERSDGFLLPNSRHTGATELPRDEICPDRSLQMAG